MGDKMTPIAFSKLVDWMLTELETKKTVFGIHHPYKADAKYDRLLFGRKLETPVGPAAGPHTQLAQNIVAAYYAGSRFFELKTVQIIDGEELPVSKPCIKADDECYNVEWSTELYVPQALDEYIKAWFLLHVAAKEFELGNMDGFQFNMSVGYDLEGIKSEKINTFIESLKDAEQNATFIACKKHLVDHIGQFRNLTEADVNKISSQICNSATLSTLHGCPPQEIERIAVYLMKEKGLHTFVKCNPTLLGYEFARRTMDQMGYDYVSFGEFHFLDDLQYEDAVPMLQRLMLLADGLKISFGVKITNTFPVDIKQEELPGEEMYMSGKSLYPLSISLAAKLAEEFGGKLRISYSGGAAYHNIEGITKAGIWPVTVATTLLKPGGYQRMQQLAEFSEQENLVFQGVDVSAVKKLAEDAVTDCHHVKALKPLPSIKRKEAVTLMDCFTAPCKEGCPIHQDITAYLQLVEEGRCEEALRIITEKNPLPFITGTICAHNCMSQCNRNFYEEPVNIRGMKLLAAEGGYESIKKTWAAPAVTYTEKAAIVGGGPAGLAAAFFLARAGMKVVLFEERSTLGGVVKHIIPDFRITGEAIDKDVAFVKSMGVEVRCNTKIASVEELKEQGYAHIVLAIGAWKPGVLELKAGNPVNALTFLSDYKATKGKLDIGKNVVVIGGGNTAMDTARAAKRTAGVEHVYLVYRRTKRYMPADEEELRMAVEDDVELKELLAPIKMEDGKLFCKVMKLGELDASGRRGVTQTEETVELSADTVIAAVGEQVPTEFLQKNGIAVNERGKALLEETTLETDKTGVYLIGDGRSGPATVVEAIRDARKAADAILGVKTKSDFEEKTDLQAIYAERGRLEKEKDGREESSRCLTCSAVCENCVEVCPNRANLSIAVQGMEKHQIIHVDAMCNECGNCKSFCPYASAPYLDKFTLFATEADMRNSKNQGFAVLDAETVSCKVRFLGNLYDYKADSVAQIPEGLGRIMKAVCEEYAYLL